MESIGPLEALVAILVPLGVIFTVIVLPIWLILHYVSKRKSELTAAHAEDPMTHTKLQSIADRLEKRVQALETILDAEVPGWRKHDERNLHRRNS